MNPTTVATHLCLICALSVMIGCGREATPLEGSVPTQLTPATVDGTWPSSNAVPAKRFEWNRRTLAAAYNSAGERDPRWNSEALEALEAFAIVRCETDTNRFDRCKEAVARAVRAGCPDPLIAYINLRYLHGASVDANAAGAEAFCEVAERMRISDYPEIRKFYSALRAAEALKSAHPGSSAITKRLSAFRRGAFEHLRSVLAEPDLPFIEAYEAAEQLYQAIISNTKQENDILPVIIDCFQSRWPHEARALNLCGRAHVQLAWNQRGTGYADSVTEQGWQQFALHLAEAERALERSWELDPTIDDTAVTMIRVELGQGKGRARMETWFRRAMTVNPACYDAAHAKVWYLQPKWHGSERDAIAFGRDCVKSKQWKGRVPLILWETHRMLAYDSATGLKDAYWKQPGVWADVRDSFERFYELNPEATYGRHEFASCAYKCEQFATFLELIARIQRVNYDFFGGEQRLAEMVAFAKLKSGR